jgi:hypothetical protein
MNILEAVTDENLLGAAIKDHVSFAPWKALLASVFGLSLDADQLSLYRQCTGRTSPPSAQFKSVFICAGRRAGKSVCMALLAVYLATFRDWRPKLTAGERAVILLVAGDRDQAKYYLSRWSESPSPGRIVGISTKGSPARISRDWAGVRS